MGKKKRGKAIVCLLILIGQWLAGQTLALGAILMTKEGEDRGPELSCRAYCVMDRDSGEILFSKNADRAYPPASITKVLTALVVAEQCKNLDVPILVPEETFEDLELVSSSLTPPARAMEQLTVRDLLYGMILASANECASALACFLSGSAEAFADQMNERARQAGATNSHFVNAHGLDAPSHRATASDMARIFQAALDNPVACEVLSAREYTIPANTVSGERKLTMGHAMVNGSWQAEGVYAGKTGFTVKAGRTLLTAVRRNGRDLLIVTMGSEAASIYWDAQILMDYSFAMLSGQEWEAPPIVCSLRVSSSGPDGCVVSGWMSDAVVRAEAAVWSIAGGQDDLLWQEVTLQDNWASFVLDCADHGGEMGLYTVIFYGYAADGSSHGVSADVLVTGNPLPLGMLDWNGGRYWILENRTPAVGICETEEGVFFADAAGKIQTGAVVSDGAVVLLEEESGTMADGWHFFGGDFYYMQKSGEAAVGRMQIDGRLYEFDLEGRLVRGRLFPATLHTIAPEAETD